MPASTVAWPYSCWPASSFSRPQSFRESVLEQPLITPLTARAARWVSTILFTPSTTLSMFRNFRPTELLNLEYGYEWVLFAAHVLGAGILLSSRREISRLPRWFFVAQTALFPLGIVALPFLPFLVLGFFTGQMDREGFVDIPFILGSAQPVWVTDSLLIVGAFRGAGLGLSRVPSALTQALRAGLGAFARAMRPCQKS